MNSSDKRRRQVYLTAIFAAAVLLPSLYGFGGKFIELVAVLRGESDGAFAVTPIVNYLLATLGFSCLFGWAALQGMFSDVERPKEVLLETEDWLDRRLADRRSPEKSNGPGGPSI
jgi:hypothetical protein